MIECAPMIMAGTPSSVVSLRLTSVDGGLRALEDLGGPLDPDAVSDHPPVRLDEDRRGKPGDVERSEGALVLDDQDGAGDVVASQEGLDLRQLGPPSRGRAIAVIERGDAHDAESCRGALAVE